MAAVMAAWLAGGCWRPGKSLYDRLQDEDPNVRLEAVVEAGKTKDVKALPYLVDRLTDTEEEIVAFAAYALRLITGKDLGPRICGSPRERREAADKWRKLLREMGLVRPTTRPREGPGPSDSTTGSENRS